MLKQTARRLRRAAASAGLYVTRYRENHEYVAEPHAWGLQRRVRIHDERQFLALAEPVRRSGRCLLGYDRLYVLWQCARNVAPLRGAAAEVGSYRGGSAYFIASAFRALGDGEAPMHIFDTFEGHPDKIDSARDSYHRPGMFAETSFDQVRDYLSPFRRLVIHKGEFSREAGSVDERGYMLAHIDVDIYQTTLDALRYFGGRLLAGGVLVVDDFGAPKCPGVAEAVERYLGEQRGYHVWHMRTEQVVLVKVAS